MLALKPSTVLGLDLSWSATGAVAPWGRGPATACVPRFGSRRGRSKDEVFDRVPAAATGLQTVRT